MINIRLIEKDDNPFVADIIRTVLEDFDANKPGFAAADPETDRMFESYQKTGTAYWVATINDKIVGCAGVGKLKGYSDACELQKMYVLSEARGQKIGQQLIEKCMNFAEKHYKVMYLETLKGMDAAQTLYKRYDFRYIAEPLGKTGHFGCDVYMAKWIGNEK